LDLEVSTDPAPGRSSAVALSRRPGAGDVPSSSDRDGEHGVDLMHCIKKA